MAYASTAARSAGAFLLAAVLLTPALSAQDGFGERIGAQLDRGLEKLGDELRENWQSFQQFVDKMGVQGRVYSRLKWDKDLTEAAFELEVSEGGVVTLTGEVPDARARQKAISVTEDTVGVTRVVDRLTVAEARP